jgi:hypothetical protein
MDESWKGSYDAWKLATPPEYEWTDRPEPQQDPGPCRLCNGTGWIVCTTYGRYVAAGPLPEYSSARGVHDAQCDACGGSGEIVEEEEDEDDGLDR